MDHADRIQPLLEHFLENQDLERRAHRSGERFRALLDETGLDADGWRELLVLLLFYGSPLAAAEIARLRRKDVSRAEMGRVQIEIPPATGGEPRVYVLSPEVSDAVLRLLSSPAGGSPEEQLLAPTDAPLSPGGVFDLVQRYSNERLLLQAVPDLAHQLTGHHVVLPIAARLDAHPFYTGRGVTVAFVDTGFSPHPDLLRPEDRIAAYVDLSLEGQPFERADAPSWHGTMTSVCCAGNGYLSGGLYAGLAREARVVLLAVGPNGPERPERVTRALRWVLENRERHGIRIVSVSLAAEGEVSFRESEIDALAELAVQAGLVVVAAAGNDPLLPSLPPANAPHVITVGGLVDKNVPWEARFSAYPSQFGTTPDGLSKPELLAPARLVASPLLPGTDEFRRGRVLAYLRSVSDDELSTETARHEELLRLESGWRDLAPLDLRETLDEMGRRMKLVAPHYQHVDGTSVAAPIVASVVAQMLEARPELAPDEVRQILLDTAQPVPHWPRERQGFGVVRAREAVELALRPEAVRLRQRDGVPRVEGSRVTFELASADVESVSVAGDFNRWDPHRLPLRRLEDGRWTATTEIDFPGTYRYKLVLDQRFWIADQANPRREADGFQGENSLFDVSDPAFVASSLDRLFASIHGSEPLPEEERSLALSALDLALGWPTAGRSAAVERYYVRCLGRALERLDEDPVADLEIIQLYNCSTLVRSRLGVVAFDVVSGRHVWGLGWSVPDELLDDLARRIDCLFVTQRAPDHLDLGMVARILEAGGRVVVPQELHPLVPSRAQAAPLGSTLALELPSGSVTARVHRARHRFDEEARVVQRCYEITLPAGSVYFAADHDHRGAIDHRKPVDLLVVRLENESDDDPGARLAELVGRVRPRAVLPTHLVELGHPDHGLAQGYDRARAVLEEAEAPGQLLSWGERWRLGDLGSRADLIPPAPPNRPG